MMYFAVLSSVIPWKSLWPDALLQSARPWFAYDLHIRFPTGLLILLSFSVMHGMYSHMPPEFLWCHVCMQGVYVIYIYVHICIYIYICGVHDCRKKLNIRLNMLSTMFAMIIVWFMCVCICEVCNDPSLQCLYCMSCVCDLSLQRF